MGKKENKNKMERRNISFINTNPHFFKPLLPDFLTNFSIPESFVKYLDNAHEENGEKIAILKDRREKTYWQVKIVGDGDCDDDHDHGVLYFRDGWEEFCKDHGLQVGDVLVFEHKGHLVFDVSIFDPSACERELQPPLMVKASSSDHRRRNGTPLHGKQVTLCSQGSKKNQDHKDRPLRRATFKPRGYPYFQTLVKSYWPRSGMHIPLNFARENGLDKKTCKMVMVVDTKGKTWKLPIYHYMNIYIGSWGNFHAANSLKPDLPVVFELINPKKNYPVFNFYKLLLPSEKTRGHKDHPLVRSTFKPRGYPYFHTLVKSYWPRNGMLIPLKFARENGLEKKNCKMIMVVDTKGKTWKLPIHHYKSVYIGSWAPFHVANSLKTDLHVVFELISSKKNHPIFNFYKLS